MGHKSPFQTPTLKTDAPPQGQQGTNIISSLQCIGREGLILSSLAGKDYMYLIFVISFTQAKILDRKFYTEERVNYGKRISRQNCDLLAQANYTNYTLCVKLHTECKSWVSFV